jgi:hypothetical protein
MRTCLEDHEAQLGPDLSDRGLRGPDRLDHDPDRSDPDGPDHVVRRLTEPPS